MSHQLEQVESALVEDEKPVAEAREIAGKSPLQIAMGRLVRDKVAMVSLGIVVFFALIAIFAPFIAHALHVNLETQSTCAVTDCNAASYGYGLPLKGPPLHGFDPHHPFGIAPADGTDNLANWLYGARNSLFIATMATVISTIIGLTLGLIAGYLGGIVDRMISFVTDLFLAVPYILAALSLAPILDERTALNPALQAKVTFWSLIGILSVLGWMYLARLMRGEVLSLREREYVEAARLIGMPTRRILIREILPNLVAPIVVAISLGLPAYVTAEAGLAFLGIGIVGKPSWGQTIDQATNWWQRYPLYLWEPVIGIVLLVVALNLLGDSIRDALDPKTRR
ncbi:MAG TPA: ABC transporter permease [Marmoricola sp.]|nr:ABC transporter permease [Marmoricola sp.]